MFVEERQSLILQELSEKGKVRVKDLAERFNVTEDLIRKDLHVLEKQGKLARKYGGAVLIRQNVQRKIVAGKKKDNTEAKKQIAQKAFEQIQPGMIVFLDISTINIQLAKLIAASNLPITVVTNMLEIMNIMVNTNVNIISIGGELDYGRDGFIGPLAYEMLKAFRFDMAFMGAVGVDVERNSVEIYMANEGLTKKQVLSASKKCALMVEEEKLHLQGNYQYADLEDFDLLITDQPITDEMKEQLYNEHGVSVLD
jgi:DeoR family glycerol-3-phosphate regulon repressor